MKKQVQVIRAPPSYDKWGVWSVRDHCWLGESFDFQRDAVEAAKRLGFEVVGIDLKPIDQYK